MYVAKAEWLDFRTLRNTKYIDEVFFRVMRFYYF